MLYKILIVDDDDEFLDELKEFLHEYSIICAKSGREALSLFKKPHLIDLVILDVKLPDMTGTEILKEIKEKSPNVGVIISTGLGNKEVLINALRGNADDFLEKPFTPDALGQTIQRVLGRAQGKIADTFSQPRDISGKIELAKRFAKNNFDKKITLNDVAKELCLSPKYFSRLFKERAGQGFNEYRLRMKFDEAKRLLEGADVNIAEVARVLGYDDTKPLTRLFRKYAGDTPGGYRARRSKETKRK